MNGQATRLENQSEVRVSQPLTSRSVKSIMTYQFDQAVRICLATQRIVVYDVYSGTSRKLYKFIYILSRPGLPHFLQLSVRGVMSLLNLSPNHQALRTLFLIQRYRMLRRSRSTSAKEHFFSISSSNTSVKVEICLRCNMADSHKHRFD